MTQDMLLKLAERRELRGFDLFLELRRQTLRARTLSNKDEGR